MFNDFICNEMGAEECSVTRERENFWVVNRAAFLGS